MGQQQLQQRCFRLTVAAAVVVLCHRDVCRWAGRMLPPTASEKSALKRYISSFSTTLQVSCNKLAPAGQLAVLYTMHVRVTDNHGYFATVRYNMDG